MATNSSQYWDSVEWQRDIPAPLVANYPTPTRSEIMECAKRWVQEKVPYCQCNADCCGNCPHCHTTRCDCSGYVSYCWGFRVGYTTFNLGTISHRIPPHELQPGDILLYAAEHVIIFGGWANSDRTLFHAYQEPGCHTAGPHHAYNSVMKYPVDWGHFIPFRYNHLK